MPFPAVSDLSPEDIEASRTLFSKIFQGLLPFHSLNFYFPERPQSALAWKEEGNLEEFVGSKWATQKEMHYDPLRKRLYWPLLFHGKLKGFLVLFGWAQVPGTEKKLILERLSGLALDMTALKKQVQSDPATGLYHQGAFRKQLIRMLKDFSKKGIDRKPEKLSLAKDQPSQGLILGFLAFQPRHSPDGSFSTSLEAESRAWIKEITGSFPEETILGTIHHTPLVVGFVIPFPNEGDHPFRPPSQGPSEKAFPFVYHLGWAALSPRAQDNFQGNLSFFSLMTQWWEKAWTALELAPSLGDNVTLSYDEILFRAGRVMDLLPSHRIVINLGQKAGVDFFMRFSILEEGDPERQKGLAVPVDIQEDLCIAEVINLREAGLSIQKNDRVCLVSPGHQKMEDLKEEVLLSGGPLRSFQMFQQKFRRALKNAEKFALLIARLDDYNDRLKIWGEKGLLEIQKEIDLNLKKRLPAAGLVGPYGRDGFILFIPGMDKKEGQGWAEGLIEQFKQTLDLSFSFALADYPCPPFHKGDILDNTIKALDHLSFLEPGSFIAFDSVSLNISGDKFYNQGDLTEAVREYERALFLDPNNINALNSLGVCYANQGHLEQAVESFRRVLHLSPDDFMASFNLGFALSRLGKKDKAIQIWETLAEKTDANFDLAYNLGRLHRDEGNLNQANHWFKRAEEAPAKKGFIFRVLGESEESLGKEKEAMIWFKKALKLNPRDAFCLSRLGGLYLQQGESIRVALSLCQQATRIEPTRGTYWLNLGKAFLMNDFPQKALNALQQALDKGGPPREAYRLMGLSFRTLGKHKEAQNCFIEALKQDPGNEEIQSYLNEEEDSR